MMSPLAVSLIALGCMFGGTLLGMFLRTVLPEHHLKDESTEVVKLGTGMISVLAALVLGLLIASAKGTLDLIDRELNQAGSEIIALNNIMVDYGPETREARDLLRRSVVGAIDSVWPEEKTGQGEVKGLAPAVGLRSVRNALRHLSPHSDDQRWLKSQALQLITDVAETRWFVAEHRGESSLPEPFLVILVFWLTIIFFSFGMLSPRNATVVTILFVCILSVASALYLMLELDHPQAGLIKMSSDPLRYALVQLGP